MLKVLMCSAEVEPFAKTGGLGDVMGSLPKALSRNGVSVSVVMPKYKVIPHEYQHKMTRIKYSHVSLGWREQYYGVCSYKEDGVTYYFIENEYYFGGDSVYTNTDLERFCFFEMAVASMLEDGDFSFDVVHCHDWQTGLIPALIKCRDIPVKTVYTIHNLQYQGIFPWNEVQDYLSLPYEYFGDGRIEFYGQVNFMKAGITFADKVTTVSETYAEEIKYPYFGERLDGLIVSRGDVTGIVNGVDYDFYSPKNNEYLFKKYTVNNFKAGKAENKAELQKLLGLEQNPDVMMIGMVGRLSRQKGLELVEYVFDEIMGLGVQFVIIGVGEPHFEELFRYYAWQYSGRVSANIMFQNDRAHKIYAGADAFLMPSLYEPCGLGQIISLAYGTVPIVREVGGLKDTVRPYNAETKEGNGFNFHAYNAHDMLNAIKYALEIYNRKPEWEALVETAMRCDFSWDKSARLYEKLYESALG